MTAAVYRNTPSLSIPPSQNTAPILEFNCLYTHDTRKKAKKWQDGFLRFHTFNKRVMVYDVPRNFVGDMHWTSDEALQEGDELTLERNGALVQVGDSIGRAEADLSELRKSTKKAVKPGQAGTPARTAPVTAARLSTAPQRPPVLSKSNTQVKHRSLNALLGTPKGVIGKAVLLQKSPFEERREVVDLENEEWEEGRPPKRARTDSAPAWSVTRTTKTPKSAKAKETPMWARTSDASKQKKKQALAAGQQRLGTMEVVELSDDDPPQNDFLPGFSDAALAPSSPHKERSKKVRKQAAGSSSPAFQIRENRIARKSSPEVPNRQPPQLVPDRGNPVGRISIPRQGDHAAVAAHKTKSPSPKPSKPTSSRPGQRLRLAASAPRKKTLLCQDQLTKKPKRLSSTNTDVAADSLLDAADSDDELGGPRPKSAAEQLKARIARIDQKNGSTSSAKLQSVKKKTPAPIEIPSDHDSSSELEEDEDDSIRPATSHETSAFELARLDEMIMPPAPKPIPTSRTMSPEQNEPPETAPQAQPKEIERPYRRTVSEAQKPSSKPKRIPGAPVRYTPTPSPTKKSRESTPVPPVANKKNSIPSMLAASNNDTKEPASNTKQPDFARSTTMKSRRPLSKSVSLNVTANGTSAVMLSKQFKAPGKASEATKLKPLPPPEPQGPWTREAFDLFTWRPPGWDEERWCVKDGTGGKENEQPPVGLSGGVSMPYK